MNPNESPVSHVGLPDEESRDELRRRLDAQQLYAVGMKEELEKGQRKLMAVEMRVRELNTSALAAEALAAERAGQLEDIRQAMHAAVQDAETRCDAAVARLKIAPQVDRGLRSLAVELTGLMVSLKVVPPPRPESIASLVGLNALSLVEHLRAVTREAQAVIGSTHDRHSHSPYMRGGVGTADAIADDGEGAAGSSHGRLVPRQRSGRSSPVRSPSRAVRMAASSGGAVCAEGGGDEDPDRRAAELAAFRDQVRWARAQEAATRDRCERMTDVARRDCATAKQENRALAKAVKDLQARQKKHEQAEVSLLALERAKRDAAEAKKHMAVAVAAKQQELENLQRTHSQQLQNLLMELEKHRRGAKDVAALQLEVASAKDDARAATSQVARSGVLQAQTEVGRLKRLSAKLQDQLATAESDLRERDRRIQGLQRDALMATDQYNALFAAHVMDDKERLKAQEKVKQLAIREVVRDGVGDNQQYKQRYEAEAAECAKLRRQLKHVLVLVRHHEVEQDLATTNLRMGRDGSADWISRHDTSVAAAHDALEADESLQQLLSQAGEDDPSDGFAVRVDRNDCTLDARLPAYGSDNEYGSPTVIAGLEDVSAVVQHDYADQGEVSTRSVTSLLRRRGRGVPTLRSKHNVTAHPRVRTEFAVMLGGEPRPSSPAAVIESIEAKRNKPAGGGAPARSASRLTATRPASAK
jgi:hypothetical protein